MPSADTEIEKWEKVSVNEMYLVSSLGRIKSLRKEGSLITPLGSMDI